MVKAGKLQIIKYAPPPPELPVYGRVDPEEVSFFGRTNYSAALEEKKFIFGIKRVDRKKHVYIIGKTGTGKSKLIELLARQDIAYGQGACVMDPSGDIVENLLDFIPEERVEDTVVIDPLDSANPISFNPLAGISEDLKHQFAQDLVDSFKKQFGYNWTPRIEHVFRFAILALLDYPHATLSGIISMITESDYRASVVRFSKDAIVRRFWEKEFAEWTEKFDYFNTETVIPLANKLSQFFSNPALRNIFSNEENLIDIGKMVDEGKIILVNLRKDRLGEENSGFFGSIILAKLKQAGALRAKSNRSLNDFYIYVDDFYGVANDMFENLMSESRKYGYCMTLISQYLAQLTPKMQSAVLGNAGTVIVFRVGGEDAGRLKPEMSPVFDVKDMINLGTQEFYIKEMIDGETYDPFSAETLKVMPPAQHSNRERIIELSRDKYSAKAEKGENKIPLGTA